MTHAPTNPSLQGASLFLIWEKAERIHPQALDLVWWLIGIAQYLDLPAWLQVPTLSLVLNLLMVVGRIIQIASWPSKQTLSWIALDLKVNGPGALIWHAFHTQVKLVAIPKQICLPKAHSPPYGRASPKGLQPQTREKSMVVEATVGIKSWFWALSPARLPSCRCVACLWVWGWRRRGRCNSLTACLWRFQIVSL